VRDAYCAIRHTQYERLGTVIEENCPETYLEGRRPKLDKIKVGFIGAGVFANAMHYPSLAELEDVELVAICDLDEERLSATAQKFQIRETFTDYKEMLSKVKLDAVYVVMGPKLIKPIALDCLSRGLHLFVEKPPGISLEEAEEMAEIASRNSCTTMVGFNRRFTPVVREARRIVGENGKITLCVGELYKFHLFDTPYYGTPSWLLIETHQLDTLRWLGGEVIEVKACIQSFKSKYPNIYTVLLQFKSGASGVLIANFASGARRERFEIHGEGIAAYLQPPNRGEIYKKNPEFTDPQPAIILEGRELIGSSEPRLTYGYFEESRHFIECIKEGRDSDSSLEEAVETMRLVEKIDRSIKPRR